MSEEDLFEEYERNYIKEHTTSIKCYTEEAYNKLQQENKQLKEDLKDACYVIEKLKKDKKKAIEYINTTDKWLCRVNDNLCVETIGKDKLLEILGDKE